VQEHFRSLSHLQVGSLQNKPDRSYICYCCCIQLPRLLTDESIGSGGGGDGGDGSISDNDAALAAAAATAAALEAAVVATVASVDVESGRAATVLDDDDGDVRMGDEAPLPTKDEPLRSDSMLACSSKRSLGATTRSLEPALSSSEAVRLGASW
jgi:hypothetical protein